MVTGYSNPHVAPVLYCDGIPAGASSPSAKPHRLHCLRYEHWCNMRVKARLIDMLCLARRRMAARTPPDMHIERSALLPYSALDMYRLVHDVPAYPHFLSWCRDAAVHEQDDTQQLASLWVKVGGLTQQFTTRNRLVPGELLTMSLVEGPFRRLSGEWRFVELGESGSKVSLDLTFEFSNTLLSSAFRRGFARISDRMVGEFARRAEDVYG